MAADTDKPAPVPPQLADGIGDLADGLSSAVQRAMLQKGQDALLPLEQLDLLGGQQAANVESEAPRVRGAGRPPGALNKRTSDWTDHILANYQSPLVFLAKTFSRPVELLAAELGASKADAFALQIDAAKNLAPYVHQKQPLAVNVDSRGVIQLILETPGEPGAAGVSGSATGPLLDIVANQGDSE
jgi:hypothetical protein